MSSPGRNILTPPCLCRKQGLGLDRLTPQGLGWQCPGPCSRQRISLLDVSHHGCMELCIVVQDCRCAASVVPLHAFAARESYGLSCCTSPPSHEL
jgi:hypothetical protein